jgi:hypothetical protein
VIFLPFLIWWFLTLFIVCLEYFGGNIGVKRESGISWFRTVLNCVGLNAVIKIIFHKMKYLACRTTSIIDRRILDNETLI